MVFIPGGDFSRGRTYDWPDTKFIWYPTPLKDDLPVRQITVDAFFMDQAEVTNERYAAFVKATRIQHAPNLARGNAGVDSVQVLRDESDRDLAVEQPL